MEQSLHFKSQSLLLEDHLLLHLKRVRAFPLYIRISATAFPLAIEKSPLIRRPSDLADLNRPSLPTSLRLRTQNPVMAARRNRRRTGWRISTKTALECVSFVALNLKLLPEPLDLVIREAFGGGHGGGVGIWKGFGGGGFDGWGRRRRGNKLGLFGLLLGVCAFVLLILRKEPESDLVLGVLGLVLLGFSIWDWQNGMKSWVLGFCSCALMVFWGLKREHLQICLDGVRVRSLPMKIARRGRRLV